MSFLQLDDRAKDLWTTVYQDTVKERIRRVDANGVVHAFTLTSISKIAKNLADRAVEDYLELIKKDSDIPV